MITIELTEQETEWLMYFLEDEFLSFENIGSKFTKKILSNIILKLRDVYIQEKN